MATIAKGHVVNCAPFAHKSQCMRVQRPSECALRMRFEFARSCVRLPSRSRMRSIVVCMRFVRAKRKCTQHSRRRESGCACVRMRLQFACAFVRMHSHVSMLQPSSSGVMHAKPRGVHGTGQARHDGTSTPPHKKCEHGNARHGLCVQVLHLAGLQRRHVRRSWSTAAYFESSRVCRHVILSKVLQTLPWGLKSTPRSRWHPLGEGQKAGLLIHGFQFVNHL